MLTCNRCGAEMISLDPFTNICPDGIELDHSYEYYGEEIPGKITFTGYIIPDYCRCEKCNQIYPAKQSAHYHKELGWNKLPVAHVYSHPNLFDLRRHLCHDCMPQELIKFDYVRKMMTGRGR